MDTPLRKLRESLGLTLHEVAVAIGTDTGNLSRLETGAQRSVDLAPKLVDFYRLKKRVITEGEILYPERYPAGVDGKRPKQAQVAAR